MMIGKLKHSLTVSIPIPYTPQKSEQKTLTKHGEKWTTEQITVMIGEKVIRYMFSILKS